MLARFGAGGRRGIPGDEYARRLERIRVRLEVLERQLAQLDAALHRDFPDFSVLAVDRPAPGASTGLADSR